MPPISAAAFRRWPDRALIAAAALAVAATANAQADDRDGLTALRDEDARVARVGWQLARANADLCRKQAPLSGLILYDAAQFSGDYRPAADRAFGTGRGTVVAVVVPGSAGDRGGLRAGDVIRTIDGSAMPAARLSDKPSFEGVERALARIEAALRDGAAALGVERAGVARDLTLAAEPGCASFIQLVPSGERNASSDGSVVTITTASAAFARDDGELAALVAHELAHNMLQHRARLDAQKVSRGLFAGFGRNGRRLREAEDEADRLSVHLLRRAGYDPEAAIRFWTRFGAAAEPVIGDGTHRGWKARVALMRDEIATMRGDLSDKAVISGRFRSLFRNGSER